MHRTHAASDVEDGAIFDAKALNLADQEAGRPAGPAVLISPELGGGVFVVEQLLDSHALRAAHPPTPRDNSTCETNEESNIARPWGARPGMLPSGRALSGT